MFYLKTVRVYLYFSSYVCSLTHVIFGGCRDLSKIEYLFNPCALMVNVSLWSHDCLAIGAASITKLIRNNISRLKCTYLFLRLSGSFYNAEYMESPSKWFHFLSLFNIEIPLQKKLMSNYVFKRYYMRFIIRC